MRLDACAKYDGIGLSELVDRARPVPSIDQLLPTHVASSSKRKVARGSA
jgi:hypothetical protein